jgi:hypothetical protein
VQAFMCIVVVERISSLEHGQARHAEPDFFAAGGVSTVLSSVCVCSVTVRRSMSELRRSCVSTMLRGHKAPLESARWS